MTEAEIMKALECHKEREIDNCCDCPYFNIDGCAYEMSKDALDLINRKNAEIEKANTERENVTETYIQVCNAWYKTTIELQVMRDKAKTARDEAIKEFYSLARARATKGKGFFGNAYYSVSVYDLDQIAKEMGVEL